MTDTRGRRAWTAMAVLAPLLAVLLALPASDCAAEIGIKHRVIVGSFDDKAEHHWYHGPGPGQGMADMLITALVKSGEFKVFERAALDEILAEKNLSLSDLANPGVEASRKVEIGDILVKGVITEFGYKEETVGGSLASGVLKRAKVSSYSGRVAVDLRLIHLGTSEVLWADTVTGSESSRSLGLASDKFSFGDQKHFDEHVVGKATRKVINAIVEKLVEQTSKLSWTGILIGAEGFWFIDAGSEIGIEEGVEFTVRRLKKEVKHPKTGAILKRIYEDVGVVKATEVEEGVTTVAVVSGSGFQDGDIVTIRE
ncbi:MAG: hypothetical protein JW819_04275 [Candidatus Krumholzibacteriota bacterium]|nr:hypothetical protein [Candidatus Krumholzibacteriota bacterium]